VSSSIRPAVSTSEPSAIRRVTYPTRPRRQAARGGVGFVLLALLLVAAVTLWWSVSRRVARPPVAAAPAAEQPPLADQAPVADAVRAITRTCDLGFPPAGLVRREAAFAATGNSSATTLRNRTGIDRVVDLIVDRQVHASLALPAYADATVDLPARSFNWQLRSGASWCSDGRFARETIVEMLQPLEIVASSRLTIQIDADSTQASGLRISASDAPVVRAAPAVEPTAGATPIAGIVLPRTPEGHYFIDGAINGVATRFLVDTGATSVVIPAALAQQLGFYNGPEVTSRTANGTTVGYRFTARSLAFGPFAVDEATIVALPNVHVPLLGMSVLQSVDLQQTQRGLELRPRR
jgi:aspartyl protease family protein